MMKTDLRFGEVYDVASLADVTNDRVNVTNLWGNDNGGVALLAFKEGQNLDVHTAPAEVMVCVVEGEIMFNMMDMPHRMGPGQFLLMGVGVPHSVMAMKDSKVMLVKIKAES